MEVTYTAKVVTPSRPYLIKEGNTWISDIVYKKDGVFLTRKVLAPNVDYGPYEVGEEIEIQANDNDELAEDYLIEIYNNPKAYKDILRRKRHSDVVESEEYKTEKKNIQKERTTEIITTFISIAIIGVLLVIVMSVIK